MSNSTAYKNPRNYLNIVDKSSSDFENKNTRKRKQTKQLKEKQQKQQKMV
jgi:cell shape-determining protein MreC